MKYLNAANLGSAVAIISTLQGTVGILPVDPVMSSGFGAILAVALWVVHLLKKRVAWNIWMRMFSKVLWGVSYRKDLMGQ